jgi:hypothetical protein
MQTTMQATMQTIMQNIMQNIVDAVRFAGDPRIHRPIGQALPTLFFYLAKRSYEQDMPCNLVTQ